MPISNLHPQAEKVAPYIKRTCDAYNGDVQDYVPRLSGQSNADYEAYTGRSSYYNVIERTLTALIGALTRRSSSFSNIAGGDPVFYGDIGSDEFVTACYGDIFMTGRTGLLVDFDDNLNIPYITNYRGDNIINWGEDFYVLSECYYGPDPKDRYNQIYLTRFRELMIDEAGYYAVRIWEQKKNRSGNYNSKPDYEVVDVIEPTIRGARMTYIPFTIVSAAGVGAHYVPKPPLSTMADINIDHFKTSVDIGHAAHFIAIPTPYIAGDLQSDQSVVRLGTDQFIHLTQGSATGFLEYSGAGMATLFSLRDTKEAQMYSLGSRMLQYKKGVESSDSLQIRLGAEGASLVQVATSLEEGLEQVLYHYNLWMGFDQEAEVDLNKDVSPSVIDPQQVQSLLALYQQGVITIDTLLQRLYEGEIVDDVAEELAGTGKPVKVETEDVPVDPELTID